MTADDFTRGLLVLLAWRDGYANGANGMIAIMQVVANRVKAGWDGGDWCRVIWDVLGDDLGGELVGPDPRDPVVMQALQAVDGVFSGELQDRLTGGGVWYSADEEAAKLMNGFERSAQVGALTFWKGDREDAD